MIQGAIKPAPSEAATVPTRAARLGATLAIRFAAMLGRSQGEARTIDAASEPAPAAPATDTKADPEAIVVTARQVIAALSVAGSPAADPAPRDAGSIAPEPVEAEQADTAPPAVVSSAPTEPAPDSKPVAAEQATAQAPNLTTPEPPEAGHPETCSGPSASPFLEGGEPHEAAAPPARKAAGKKAEEAKAGPAPDRFPPAAAAPLANIPPPLLVAADDRPATSVTPAVASPARKPPAERRSKSDPAAVKAIPIAGNDPKPRPAEPALPASWASAFSAAALDSGGGKADDTGLSVALPSAGEVAVGRRLDLAKDSQWLDQLARDIVQAARSDSKIRFELTPETLGALTVEIANSAEGTAIRMTTASEHSHRAIEQAQPQLVAEARAQGLRVTETQVNLDQRGGSSPEQGWARHDHQGGHSEAGGQGGGDRSPRQSPQPRVNHTHSLPDAGTEGDDDLYA